MSAPLRGRRPLTTASGSTGGSRRRRGGRAAPGSMTCASTGRPAAGQLPEPWTDEVSSMLSTPPGTPTRLADARLAAARGQAASARPVGASPATGRSAATLLGAARRGLVEAAGLTRAPERYATAHLAALRAAAGGVGPRGRRPAPGRRGVPRGRRGHPRVDPPAGPAGGRGAVGRARSDRVTPDVRPVRPSARRVRLLAALWRLPSARPGRARPTAPRPPAG